MPAIQVLPEIPSFGQELGRGLGTGVSQGLSQAIERFHEQQTKQKELQNLLKIARPSSSQPDLRADLQKKSGEFGLSALRPSEEPQWSELPPENRLALQFKYPQVANSMQKEEELRLKKQKSGIEQEKLSLRQIESEEKSAAPFMEEYTRIKSSLPDLTTSINVAEDAVRTGDLSGFGSDYWAEKLNFPQLTTAKGKQLSAATKNFMAQGKELFGARPTNYDVSLLEKMFARIGESKFAQLSAIEMQKAKKDLQEAKINAADEIRREVGRIPRNIDLLVSDRIKEKEIELQDNLRSKLEIYAALDGQKVDFRNTKKILGEDEYLVLKNGKPIGTAPRDEIKKLKGEGYKFIK